MGDGENGLAALIFVLAAGMILIGLILFFWLGWLLGRRLQLGRGGTVVIATIMGLVGIGLSSMAVVATFLESIWAPPPHLRIAVPAGFRPHWVILLEDASAPNDLVWKGHRLPFHGISAAIAVPAGGIVRVRHFGALAGRGDTNVEWSDGGTASGFAGGSAPAAIHASGYVAYERPSTTPAADDILPDGDALAAYIRSHGG